MHQKLEGFLRIIGSANTVMLVDMMTGLEGWAKEKRSDLGKYVELIYL